MEVLKRYAEILKLRMKLKVGDIALGSTLFRKVTWTLNTDYNNHFYLEGVHLQHKNGMLQRRFLYLRQYL